jgi:F0F1-type ATP synthase membrane subunit c/vacuolar-type H+-ATPase subunit K
MFEGYGSNQESVTPEKEERSSGVGLAIALAALAALGAGIAIQQFMERRLSKPEVARLRFYRYLRERGRLES